MANGMKYCGKCGHQVTPEMNFCPACQTRLNAESGAPRKQTLARENTGSAGSAILFKDNPSAQLIFTIAAAAVALIIAIFSFYWFITWFGYSGSFYNIGEYLRTFFLNFFRADYSYVWLPIVELSTGLCALFIAVCVFLRKIKFLPALACILMVISCLFSIFQIILQLIGSVYYGMEFTLFIPLIIDIIVIFVYLYLAIEFMGVKMMPSPLISLVVVAAAMFLCFVLRLIQMSSYEYFYFPNFIYQLFAFILPVLLVFVANFVAYGKKDFNLTDINASMNAAGNHRANVQPQPQAATWSYSAAAFCGKCGNPVVSGSSFCAKCGAPVNKTPQQ